MAQPDDAEVVGANADVSRTSNTVTSILTSAEPSHEKWRHPKVTPCFTATAYCLFAAEGEVHTGKVLEAVLAIRNVRHVVAAEVRVQVSHLDGPDLNVRGQSVIKTTAIFHGKRIVVAVSAFQVAACRVTA